MIKLSISNPDNLKEICKERYEASIISFRIKWEKKHKAIQEDTTMGGGMRKMTSIQNEQLIFRTY